MQDPGRQRSSDCLAFHTHRGRSVCRQDTECLRAGALGQASGGDKGRPASPGTFCTASSPALDTTRESKVKEEQTTRFLSHDLHGPAPGHARTQGRSDFPAARPAPSGRGHNPELDSQTSSPAATAARPSRCRPLPGLIVPLLSGCQDSAWHLLVTNIRKQD